MKKLLITIFMLATATVQAQDWQSLCPTGGYPYRYTTGNQFEAPSPEVSCSLRAAADLDSAGASVVSTYGTVATDSLGNPVCITTFVTEENGSSDSSPRAIGGSCEPEDAESCAEFSGMSFNRASSTVNSEECHGTCTASMSTSNAIIIPAFDGSPQYVQQYQFTGNSCGDGTSQEPPPENSTPVLDIQGDPCHIISGPNGDITTCMDTDTNCGYWSDFNGNVVTGCLSSNPPPSGGCATVGSSDAVCDATETTSPPLPDSGTEGNPAQVAFQMADEDGNVVNYYDQFYIENSTYTGYVTDSGTDPLPGGGTDGQNIDVNVEVEFECTFWFCDEPPELEEQDFVTTELIDGYNSIEQGIADVPNGNGFIEAISQSSLVGWASLTGGSCFTLPLTYYGETFVFDQHCEPWNDYFRPALAFLFFILTAWYVTSSFFSVLRAAV